MVLALHRTISVPLMRLSCRVDVDGRVLLRAVVSSPQGVLPRFEWQADHAAPIDVDRNCSRVPTVFERAATNLWMLWSAVHRPDCSLRRRGTVRRLV